MRMKKMKVPKSKSTYKILLRISLVIFSVGLAKPPDETLANKISAKEEKVVENSKETANMSSEEKLIRWAYKKLRIFQPALALKIFLTPKQAADLQRRQEIHFLITVY